MSDWFSLKSLAAKSIPRCLSSTPSLDTISSLTVLFLPLQEFCRPIIIRCFSVDNFDMSNTVRFGIRDNQLTSSSEILPESWRTLTRDNSFLLIDFFKLPGFSTLTTFLPLLSTGGFSFFPQMRIEERKQSVNNKILCFISTTCLFADTLQQLTVVSI